MSFLGRALLCAVTATLAMTLFSCGGGSTTTPVANITGDTAPAVEVAVAWPAGLPVDSAQPWETLDANGKVSACLNADSEFLPGVEHFSDCATGVTDQEETVHIESGEPGSGLVAWAMYRVVMGGEQPGVVTADVNPGVTGDGGLSEYYLGLSDYGEGQWDWHGPFTENHVRISTGADVRAGGDYLSELGNHFVCVVAYDGATVDVVGVATNSYDETDTEAPPVPAGLHAFPAYGALDVHWDDVLAGDLAGYRLYWSEADFTSADEAGVHCVDYLIGQGSHLLTNLPAATIRVRVGAVDLSGNESALSDMTSVLVYEGAGPELRLGVSAASGMINDAITLAATGATNYAWDLDGDGTYEVTGDTIGVQTADTGHTGVIRPSVRGTTDDESCVSCGAVSLVIASNSRPVANAYAAPTTGTAPLLCTLTGGGLDDDGVLVSYSWDFNGDGIFDQTDATDPGPVAHTYDTAGLYNAKFRVEDDLGSWDVDTVSILVNEPATVNNPPVADLAIGTGEEAGDAPHSVHFDASGSYDLDPGDSITSYRWDLDGDGAYELYTLSATYNHTYTVPGAFTAFVLVEDSHGEVDTASVGVTVSVVGNDDPVADLTSNVTSGDAPLDVHFDATGSTDSDGTIVQYEWDFERDGIYDGYGTVPTADHTYTAAGTYNCRVRVTDDAGAQDTASLEISVNVPGNDYPVADLTSDVSSGDIPLTVSFDASGSTDSDGSITRYEWDFDGDGNYDGYGIDPTIDHTYTSAGSFTARMRVTDDDGAQDTDTVEITVSVPGNDDPVADLTADVSSGNAPLTVIFDASGSSDSDGTIVLYEWDFDLNGAYDGYGTDPTIRHTYPDPGRFYCRVRVTDDDGAQDTSDLASTANGWRIMTIDSVDDVGEYTSMVIVNGNPAIAYKDTTNGKLDYIRATDDMGMQWSAPVQIRNIDSDGISCSLCIVNGQPAISYTGNNRFLMYIRANDADGTNWGSPANTNEFTTYSSLRVVNGHPAICYQEYFFEYLNYIRSTDINGNSWGTAVSVSSAWDSGYDCDMEIVDGFPAIGSNERDDFDLCYRRAEDANGGSWEHRMKIVTGGNTGRYSDLEVVNGNPAISFYHAGNDDLHYIRATDATGSTWGSLQTLDSDGNVGGFASMAVIDGRPGIFYRDADNECMKFIWAADADGTTWDTPVVVDATSDCGRGISCAEVAGGPAASYYDIDNGDLKYARLF